jgi:hypothetical protein
MKRSIELNSVVKQTLNNYLNSKNKYYLNNHTFISKNGNKQISTQQAFNILSEAGKSISINNI